VVKGDLVLADLAVAADLVVVAPVEQEVLVAGNRVVQCDLPATNDRLKI